MKYWLIAVSSLVSRSFRIARIVALPCMLGRSPPSDQRGSHGLARPYRDQRRPTTRRARRGRRGIGIAREPLAQLAETRPAVGARAAASPDLLHRGRAFLDHSLEVALGHRVAQADDHAFVILKMP